MYTVVFDLHFSGAEEMVTKMNLLETDMTDIRKLLYFIYT